MVTNTSRLTPFDPNHHRVVDAANGFLVARAVDQMVAKGINVPEMARRIGIDATNIYAYRRGHQTPKPAVQIALMNLCHAENVRLRFA